ncbi:hypothetical protein KI688_003551 [Linnemannia hyalina]|uniref:F-box domain-containing protein n=1 Tax=Linnemannia hyalina TaxID=64524 RepID=A0A9P7XQG4_9FUNG|nr:hypothetical protein KI688_003551 [Linnemannia hyalina]
METCPPEITHIIAEYLTKRALLHCLRVSKTWSEIFIPFLWRNFYAQEPRQLRAIDTPEFSAAVLRHGRHINSLHLGSYWHLKPFLQELPPPISPSKAPLDDKYTARTPTHIPCNCVQNLRKFELSIRRTKKEKTTNNSDLLLNLSTSPTPIFTFSLDVSLDDPPLVLWWLKNNPHILSLEFGGFNFELEWLLKRDRLLIGPSSSSSFSCAPLSSLTQLTPNLKDLALRYYHTYHGQLFRCKGEPLARFLFQVPETVETLTLSGRLEDVTDQTTPSTLAPSSHPVVDTTSPTKCTNPTNIEDHPPTHPLAVQRLSLELFTLSEDNPQHKTFLQSLGSLLRRCVRLRELSLGIHNTKHQDAIVSHIVSYLAEAKMLTTLSVKDTLADRTLARLLDRTRLVKEVVDTNNTNSTDVARLRGDEQDSQDQGKEDEQCGWRVIKLNSYTTLGPLSSAALAAQFPTLKSLDVLKCHSCPSQVLATLLTSSPGLETLTTIKNRKGGSDDYEYSYNFIDVRHLMERAPTISNGNTGQAATGWACTGLRTLKAAITNIPRPDCERTHYRARLMPARNGTEGLAGDVEAQALGIQREICRQLGRLKQLRVLWLGYETRDFKNLENYRVTLPERREELELPKKDPNDDDDDDEEEDVPMGEDEEEDEDEGEEGDDGDGDEEDEEGEEEDDDDEYDDGYDSNTDTDKYGNPLMYPLMFLNPDFQYSCLPLSLASGLDLMSNLKELRELNVEQMAHRIGLEEVQWMVANWPRLNRIIGLNVKDESIKAVEWLKKARPWIELPESVNSMRQSTWDYYYPPMRSY